MSVLNDNYKRIITEIEEKVSNPEELEFVKEKILELSTLFMDVIDNLINKTDKKIMQIEKKQQQIENQISQVKGEVDEIETDIYEEDEDDFYDFEIVCPYCNYEFVTEINGKNEVTCPECNNVIELDWNDEDEEEQTTSIGCIGNCQSCGGCTDEIETKKSDEDTKQTDDDM